MQNKSKFYLTITIIFLALFLLNTRSIISNTRAVEKNQVSNLSQESINKIGSNATLSGPLVIKEGIKSKIKKGKQTPEEIFKEAPNANSEIIIPLIKSGEIKSVFYFKPSEAILLITEKDVPYRVLPPYTYSILPYIAEEKIPFQQIKTVIYLPNKAPSFSIFKYIFSTYTILFIIVVVVYIRNRKRRKESELKYREGNNYEYNSDPTLKSQVGTLQKIDDTVPKTTFADVAGCVEAIEDLSEITEFLIAPERFEKLGAKVPKGALLVGPPGTGKTLLARAVAGEAGCAFISASGSDFVEVYVGVGAKRVRELFAKARKHEKAIIFIDEIDAIARTRSGGKNANTNDERESTLIALLNELDGFNPSKVILLAATNRPDVLDPAILRPGRLDRKIIVPNPDSKGREEILKIHGKNKPFTDDVDFNLIASRTPGMSGADLEQILNEAAIEAARRDIDKINPSCISDAIATVAMGRARYSTEVSEKDKLITAWHEAGHTLCALLLEEAPDPVSVTIIPRGGAGGVTWMKGSDDVFLSKAQAKANLIVALGGRASEEVLLGESYTQGASSDLERATEIATTMVAKYGMTKRGLMVREGSDGASHDIIDELLQEALEESRKLINENKTLLENIVSSLLKHETLEHDQLEKIKLGTPLDNSKKIERKKVNLQELKEKIKAKKEEETQNIVPTAKKNIFKRLID